MNGGSGVDNGIGGVRLRRSFMGMIGREWFVWGREGGGEIWLKG